jgi:hypothetical protein
MKDKGHEADKANVIALDLKVRQAEREKVQFLLDHSNVELDRIAQDQDAHQGQKVLDDVHAFLGRFVSYPSEHARIAHTLWIAHCHCMQHWHTTPRLAFMSAEKESGKTRCLEVTEMLTPGALLSLNMSPAAMVRMVAAGGCTILYDEIDALFGNTQREEGNVDVRSILNGGYKRGAKVHRCVVVGKQYKVEELDSFAPVALAGLRNLPDTLGSRAIIIRMRRRLPDETVEQFRIRRIRPVAGAISDRLAAWTRSFPDDLSDTEPDMPEGITDRSAECWEPLLLIADVAGGIWPDLARASAKYFVQGGKDETVSPGVELLEHIREAFGDEQAIWTETLLQRLHDRPESPWKDMRGRPLNDRGLGSRLSNFQIKSRDVRIGSVVKKGYRAEWFTDSWNRYLPPLEDLSATSATSATKLINQNKNVADVADVALNPPKPALNGHHCQHCGLNSSGVIEVSISGETFRLHGDCVLPFQESAQ